MFTITIRDHIMIAHSLPHKAFGPAQKMHGATYVIDVTFTSPKLNQQNIVIDIALAHRILKDVLKTLNYKNLDEEQQFSGKLTTTEFLAEHIHGKVKKSCMDFFYGKIKVTLGESHIAWASYEQ